MCKVIKVGMADLAVCISPDSVTTVGLGSCVGIALRDPVSKVGGLAHIMLPDSTQLRNNTNIPKFADTGIDELVRQMVKSGANKGKIVAKLAGGAQMFAFGSENNLVRIGEQNVEACKKKLKQIGIPVLSEDTGLNYGRTVIFYPENGDFVIKSVNKEVKTI